MESMIILSFHVELDGIHMESRWNSSGISVIVPGGFQRVIPYGMVESMWNGWNPPGMIWIPYGFLQAYLAI